MSYYNKDELCFSVIFGRGIYQWNGGMTTDPFGNSEGKAYLSPVLTNVITGENFFCRRTDCADIVKEDYKKKILKAPSRADILWPCDMVELSEEWQAQCRLFVEQEYTVSPSPPEQRKGSAALLFPYIEDRPLISALQILSQHKNHNWKDPTIRALIVQTVASLSRLNKQGYIYSDLHFSRFFNIDSGRIYLDFSNLVYALGDLNNPDTAELCTMRSGTYPIEFADPAIVQGSQKIISVQSQNYSLCAMLFYLMFGVYPYDGRLLRGYIDDNTQKHHIKFRDYHKMPIFIFDPDDKRNSLGVLYEDQYIIDLWNECPRLLKDIFLSTLKQTCAESVNKAVIADPDYWLDCFSQLGWN